MNKITPDKQTDIEPDYNTSAKFQDFFRYIDGIKEPLALISAEEWENPENPKITIPDSQIPYIDSKKFGNLGEIDGYIMSRDLQGQCDSYRKKLGIKIGAFEDFLHFLHQKIDKDRLKVLDFGCGKGVALEELLAFDFIDDQNSVGITVHGNSIPIHVRKNIVINDVSNIAVKEESAEKMRFDILMSIFGIIHYHPFNKFVGEDTKTFSLLHAINMVEEGGILLINRHSIQCASIRKLIKVGILRPLYESGKFFQNIRTEAESAFIVLRRPTMREILLLLKIKKGEYKIMDL